MALSKELFRLATYNSWPLQSMISPLALAKCGFSYKGRGDEVECFLCKTRISGWNEGDNPQQKHRQMAPNCQLLNDNCTDNLPMEFTLSVPSKAEPKAKSLTATDCASNQNDKRQTHGETSVLSSILDQARSRARKNGINLNSNGPGVDGSQPDFGMLQSEAERLNCSSSANEVDRSGQSVLIPERAAVDRAVPVHAHEQLTLSAGDPPKYPAFKEFSARVESFRKGIVGEGQTAEGLADAGWFHVGPNDKVRCFHCGGNLRDWEQGDDPWVEHKRWYDYCQYTKTHRPTPRPRAPESPAILTIPSNIGSFRIEPREVKARMDTPTVRAILDMGYSRDKVKAVIEIRLSTTGDDFPNAESLLEALFRLEETTTSTSAGATASSFASEDGNHSVYSNISTVASTASRSSGYSTASSSASAVLLQQDLTSLPPTNSPKDSAMSVQSKASASKDKASSVSLKPESATVATAPDAAQSRTKAKKKKNKKKKTSSLAATSSAANGDEDVATEETGEAQNDQEKMNVDEEEANIEGNFDDIPDEEASKWLEENRQLRDQRTCKVCMDAEVNTVFLPCGHLVCCATCSPHLRNCPICRTFIRGTVKTFLS